MFINLLLLIPDYIYETNNIYVSLKIASNWKVDLLQHIGIKYYN